MIESIRKPVYTTIQTKITMKMFDEFFLPYLSMPKRGPRCKIGYFRIFNYILKILYTGIQWKELTIDNASDGKPEIHYTSIYKKFASWSGDGSLTKVFEASVKHLSEENMLDIFLLNGDGTNTVTKKGGDGIGYSGHKHFFYYHTFIKIFSRIIFFFAFSDMIYKLKPFFRKITCNQL